MNKILLFTLFIFSITISRSQEADTAAVFAKFQGSKQLPLELNLLLDSLQFNLSKEQQEILNEQVLPVLLRIDSYARAISKEDIFLIGKIEIYKSLLKLNENSIQAKVDGTTVELLKNAITHTNDSFVKWFLTALLHDSENLLLNPIYKEYLLQKSSNKIEKAELRKIDKKVQLIYHWVSKINPDSVDFQTILKSELTPMLLDSLHNIDESFYLMASGSLLDATPVLIKSPSEFKFFAQKVVKPTKTSKVKKSVEQILDPLIETDKSNETSLPTPSNEDWLNNDNLPAGLKNLPKPSNDADWLQDI